MTPLTFWKSAHITYDDNPNEEAAVEAKNELMQQIFTKTMTLQVWRPEHERAGRHFVYTTRYVHFFVELLEKTNDRTNFDSLARYVKKKSSNFIDHSKLCDFIHDVHVKVSAIFLVARVSCFFHQLLTFNYRLITLKELVRIPWNPRASCYPVMKSIKQTSSIRPTRLRISTWAKQPLKAEDLFHSVKHIIHPLVASECSA